MATIAPTYDSNRSAPIPATSPTLSPTLSAMTPGFLGSSSGMFFSTFPTRSVPTSAAFVNMPPPTLANRATVLAPKLNPTTSFTTSTALLELSPPYNMKRSVIPKTPIPTTLNPSTLPPLKATSSAFSSPLVLAALAVLAFDLIAIYKPMNPVEAEQVAPIVYAKATSGPMNTAIATEITAIIMAITVYCFFM